MINSQLNALSFRELYILKALPASHGSTHGYEEASTMDSKTIILEGDTQTHTHT